LFTLKVAAVVTILAFAISCSKQPSEKDAQSAVRDYIESSGAAGFSSDLCCKALGFYGYCGWVGHLQGFEINSLSRAKTEPTSVDAYGKWDYDTVSHADVKFHVNCVENTSGSEQSVSRVKLFDLMWMETENKWVVLKNSSPR